MAKTEKPIDLDPAEIDRRLAERPFKPFRLRVCGGARFGILRPEQAKRDERDPLEISFYDETGEFQAFIFLLSVLKIEQLPWAEPGKK